MTQIVLGICTCRRPEGLERLLNSVAAIDFAGSLSVIVVDNDEASEGVRVCERMARGYRWPLACVAEGERGISYARNRAVREALRQNPSFIAMLDDDEWAESAWLAEMMAVQQRFDADVVCGPVLPVFTADQASWEPLADYYGAHLKLADGARFVPFAGGNMLVRAACFRDLAPAPFDPRFATTGGEDLVFFRVLDRRGGRMHWAAKAVVYEQVPADRMSLSWLRQRQFRAGSLNVTVQRMFAPGLLAETVRLAKTAGVIVVSLAFLIAALPLRTARTRALMMLSRGLGKLMGHLNVRVHQYGQAR
ncbi:MAG: glycosyltransferase family 2 protein [Rhodospirillales bacterium]|nr:glycosyltransferase family 2 protein [Rhodospirillales bacterium]